MRREGYELAVSRPRVLFKDINGEKCEPYELLTVDVEDDTRAASWKNSAAPRRTAQHGTGRQGPRAPRIPHPGARPDRLPGRIPDLTRGTGMASHIFDDYGPMAGIMAERRNGVLISQDDGEPWPTRCGSCRIAAACSSAPATRSTKA
jgi:GTP-binding protein